MTSATISDIESGVVAPLLPLKKRTGEENIDLAVPDEKYQELHHTQFESVIRYLDGQKLTPPWYCPKGKDGGYPKGSDGWFATLFVPGSRVFGKYFWPWLITTLNALYWTILTQVGDIHLYDTDDNNWKTSFQLGLSSTLAFLLVFRLNRSILRFWEGMKAWGNLVSYTRSLVSGLLIHGRDVPYHRDQAIIWTVTIAVSAKKSLREEEMVICDMHGLLTEEQVKAVNDAYNSPLYALHEVRYHLKELFDVKKDFGPLCPVRSAEVRQLEKMLDFISSNIAMSENILCTPLPLVYVAQLRTFLIGYLLVLPYVTTDLWGWGTVVVVSLTALIMLGLEGASAEVESPFEKGKVNDLDLDNYCAIMMKDTKQLIKTHQERGMKYEVVEEFDSEY
eukprot:scaffold69932_cov52-Attheya_sp.AAC.3